MYVRECRPSFRQRARLVDDERVDLLEALERFGVPDQHAGSGAATHADHDGHRRREPQRARARDDQHGHRAQEGMRQPMARDPTATRRRT